MKINYLEIFKKAWGATWKNRYLWWFGFFVAVSNFGSAGMSFRDKNISPAEKEKVIQFFSQNTHWIITLLSITLIIGIVFAILGIIGKGAIIAAVGKNEGKDFKSGMKIGARYFWRIFLISLVVGIFAFVAVIVLGLPVAFLFLSHNYLIGTLLAIIAFLIFVPLMIILSFMKIYGYPYAVLGNLNFWPAIENAYGLFRRNIWSSIAMCLLFIPIKLFLLMIFVGVALPLGIVSLILGILPTIFFGKVGVIVVGSLAALIFFAAIFFLKSIFEVFAQAAWVFFFEAIAKVKKEERAPIQLELVEAPKAMPVAETRKE